MPLYEPSAFLTTGFDLIRETLALSARSSAACCLSGSALKSCEVLRDDGWRICFVYTYSLSVTLHLSQVFTSS